MTESKVSRIQLSQDGPNFSRIVFGAWRLADDPNGSSTSRVISKIEACLDVGITSFDHADIYGNYTCEGIFGKALAEQPSLRKQVELITKCGIKLVSDKRPDHLIKHYDTDATHIVNSVENSLKALHTDWIDLLLIHRPDPLMDYDQVSETFQKLKKDGKVAYFGVSNFNPFQFDLLQSRLPFPLVTNQIELSVLKMDHLHDGTVDHCQSRRISPMAWSPLGGGLLFNGQSEQERRLREVLIRVGEKHGNAQPDQVALAWLLRHPAQIVPILGTNAITRIRQGCLSHSIQLTRTEWFEIWSASKGQEVP